MSDALPTVRLLRALPGDFVTPQKGLLVEWPSGSWTLYCPYCGAGSFLDPFCRVDNVLGVTIQPSLICEGCKAHFFVRRGKVEAA